MSAKRKTRYKDSNRAKGAAVALRNSAEYLSARRKSKHNLAASLIIIIVALIESVLLIMISSFSWIESTSSLIIRGANMPITENGYYEIKVGGEGTADANIDLTDYFSDVAFFRFAKASSPNGKDFFFPKFATSGIAKVAEPGTESVINGATGGAYRAGDTTDFNTAYYCIDFTVTNESSRGFKYYFENANLFTVSGASTDVNLAASKCYRLSIQAGNETPIVFSNTGAVYSAANAAGTVTNSDNKAKVKDVKNPGNYLYNDDLTVLKTHSEVCSVDGDASVDLTFRIWFEVNDPNYLMLKPEDKAELDNTQVRVNFSLKNASSDVRSFYFSDYSMASVESLGGDPANRMYFAYYDDGTISEISTPEYTYIPMVPFDIQDSNILWRTANANLRGSDQITKEMLDTMTGTYENCYYFYGSVSNGTPSILHKWKIGKEPKVTTGSDGTYTFVGFGVSGNTIYDQTNCFGGWLGDTDVNNIPKAVFFDDKMADSTVNNYNIGAESPIAANGAIYLSTIALTAVSGEQAAAEKAVAEKTIRMYYNEDSGLYQAYLPTYLATTGSTFYFYYQDSTSFNALNSAAKVTFTSTGRPDEDAPVYTALGYPYPGSLNDQSAAAGIGTWNAVMPIYLSTEIVDHLNSAAYRYRVTVTEGEYYMSCDPENMLMYAYVPTATSTNIGFKMYATYDAASPTATWATSAHGSASVFYPIDFEATARGYWNIAVLTDGTRDSVISTILTDNQDASLEYATSTDGENFTAYADMMPIDSGRWCVPGFGDNVTTIKYKFTAYTGEEVDANNVSLGYQRAVFEFTHTLSEGLYYTITE